MGRLPVKIRQFEAKPGNHSNCRALSFLKRYPLDQPIVTYCSGRTCEDSHILARLLSEAGYTSVRIFIDGLAGWQAEGSPVE